jgi:1-acyl-sn-glycerol-3-phosphate acyltransferase
MKILYTIYMWLVISLATVFWGGLLFVLLPFDRGRFSYFFCSRNWGRSIVFFSRVKVEVSGLEKIPDAPVVFMSNHQSYFDVICLVAFLPRPARFVIKRVLVYVPVFGQAIVVTGHIIIEREKPKQAFSAMDKAAEKIRKGTSIFVFPEGTRSRDHRLGAFKKGGFVLALKAGVPVLPVSITGTQSMMPKGSYSFKRPKLVRVRVGDPIDTTVFNQETKEKLMTATRKAMIRGFAPDTPEWKINQRELEDPPAPPAA